MSQTKEQHHEYMKERLNNNEIRENKNIRQKELRDELRRWWFEYKSQFRCSRCKEKVHPATLDFHHPNRDCEVDIYRLKIRKSENSRAILMKEIKKCTPGQ